MKYLVGFSRVFVGVLFIISGLIKLNDPVGFSFKLEEYFSPSVLDLNFLMPYALLLAVVLVILEVLLGVFLLIGYRKKITIFSLLAMILFFTFLTFYSAFYNKVTDCGCFGDALKLTPWQSFYKDVVLLVLILLLTFNIRFIKPLFSKLNLVLISMLSFLGCMIFAYYVLMHLPYKDFRPYKIGANIIENMIIPEDAPKAVINYNWKFKVSGGEKVVTTSGSYPKVDGEFVGVETEIVKEGYEPPIHDFTMEIDGEDFTSTLMDESKLCVVTLYDIDKAESEGLDKLNTLSDIAKTAGYKIIGLTASGTNQIEVLKAKYNLNFQFYFCDETALKTIVRSNPGIFVLNNGTIKDKVHWNDIEQLDFN